MPHAFSKWSSRCGILGPQPQTRMGCGDLGKPGTLRGSSPLARGLDVYALVDYINLVGLFLLPSSPLAQVSRCNLGRSKPRDKSISTHAFQ